jgi:3-dehydroquinate synthase class II
MAAQHVITYIKPQTSISNNPADLKAGDEVLIYDAISSQDEWYVVADVVERDGRLRIRAISMDFYFDATLVKQCRINEQ